MISRPFGHALSLPQHLPPRIRVKEAYDSRRWIKRRLREKVEQAASGFSPLARMPRDTT